MTIGCLTVTFLAAVSAACFTAAMMAAFQLNNRRERHD
jgi:hypothetical protein